MTQAGTVVSLASVTTWLSGGTPNRSNDAYWCGSIPWISATSLKSSRISDSDQHVTPEAVRAGSKLAPRGATLVLVRGMALHHEVRAGLVLRPVAFNQDVKALLPAPSILPEYLTYALQAKRAAILELVSSAGSGTGVLDTGLLKRLPIWLPHLDEQASIVDKLNDIEKLIEWLESLIAKKQAIKQGMLQQLLTGKTRLPGFEAPWRTLRLGDRVRFIKTVALSRAQLDRQSVMRYLHYGDIHTTPEVTLAAAEASMPRASLALTRSAGRLRVGDVVFVDASEDFSGVGKSVEITSVPTEGVVPGLHTIAARFEKSVLADGFKAYLQFIPDVRNALLRLASGTKVLATTRAHISGITVKLPHVEEQRAIAHAVQDADAAIGLLRHRLTKARSVKLGMMQELLTGRTRLPVRDDQHE